MVDKQYGVNINLDEKGTIADKSPSLASSRQVLLSTKTTELTNELIAQIRTLKPIKEIILLGLKTGKNLVIDKQLEEKQDYGMKLGKHEHNPQVHTDFSIIIHKGFRGRKYVGRKIKKLNIYFDATSFANAISQEKNPKVKQALINFQEKLFALEKPTGHYD